MKKYLVILLALFVAASAFAAETLPLFNATLTMGKEHRFVLVDAAGKTSGFLALGEVFAGYKLKAYDAKEGALDLEKDGKVSRISLVADAAVASAPAAKLPGTIADADAVLKAMNFEKMMEKVLAGSKKGQGAMIEQMMSQFKRPGVDMDAVMTMQKKMMDEIMSAIGGPEMTKDMTRIYSEVFTKDELQGLAAFYSTPLGQTLSDKTPEVQEKMNAAMMPRMMAVMPKVQQMMKDFATEQRTKAAAAQGGAPVPTPPPAPKQ